MCGIFYPFFSRCHVLSRLQTACNHPFYMFTIVVPLLIINVCTVLSYDHTSFQYSVDPSFIFLSGETPLRDHIWKDVGWGLPTLRYYLVTCFNNPTVRVPPVHHAAQRGPLTFNL